MFSLKKKIIWIVDFVKDMSLNITSTITSGVITSDYDIGIKFDPDYSIILGGDGKFLIDYYTDGTESVIKNILSIDAKNGLIVHDRDILKELDLLEKENDELKKEFDNLNKIVMQLYYNPPNLGGPGFEMAKQDFNNQQTKQQEVKEST